jgi:hypothetical protein
MKRRSIRPTRNTTYYYGKYRGLVVNNTDPLQLGRVVAEVPDVLGETPSGWALPCVPAAGLASGVFIVPPIGSSVWIEFEGGRIDSPIWTGGFWPTASEVPPLAGAPAPISPGQNIVLQTTGQNTILLSDAPPTPSSGGIVLRSPSGASLVLNSTGIYLRTGGGASLSMVGSAVTFTGKVKLPK